MLFPFTAANLPNSHSDSVNLPVLLPLPQAFSLLSPARTVRATVTSAGPRGGAAPAGVTGSGSSSASLASAAVLLCGAASLARRRDQVV